jgi:ribosomal protein S18 acetylase RimI-like enzyme
VLSTPDSTSLAVRAARPDEAPALAELMERTFRDTYGGNSTRSELEKYVAARFGAERQRRELEDPGLVTLLVAPGPPRDGDGEGAPVAFAQLRLAGGAPVPACVDARRPAELSRFYVDRAWHGRGVAATLMAACVAAAGEAGADALWLLVYKINAHAIAFYRKAGFAAVGSAPFRFGDEIHDDVVMVRPVGPA